VSVIPAFGTLVFLQVCCRLLFHPLLRGRPAGRGPLLPQLQSPAGHLQAPVGLATRGAHAAGGRLTVTQLPQEKLCSSDFISPGTPPSCLLGGKCRKSNPPPNPRNCCLESHMGLARTLTLNVCSRVSHRLPGTCHPG
jgi:hypothetical protein